MIYIVARVSTSYFIAKLYSITCKYHNPLGHSFVKEILGWFYHVDIVNSVAKNYMYLSKFSTGEGNENPLHYSCLENSKDGGAWHKELNTIERLHFHSFPTIWYIHLGMTLQAHVIILYLMF